MGPVSQSWLSKGWQIQLQGFSFADEDRLSKRKSIGETISLQVEVESRNSPEKEEVSVLVTVLVKLLDTRCTSPLHGTTHLSLSRN